MSPIPPTAMPQLLALLDSVLSLRGRAAGFTRQTPLHNALPELDSLAVANLLAAFEDHWDLSVDDDPPDAAVFETVGRLADWLDARVADARRTSG